MNILVLSWRDPRHPLAGGAEQVMHEHIKGWVSAGHNITFFSSRFKNAATEEIIDEVKILRIGTDLFLGVQLAALIWYLKNGKKKFDLVIDEFHGFPFFTPIYVGCKKLAVIQEVAREVWFLNYLPHPLKWVVGLIGYIVEPFLFLIYKNVPFITGSESAKKDLINFGIPSKNITVIPHGVVTDRPQNLPKKEAQKTIIYLGALAKDKGIEDAIKVFTFLQKKANFKFWVVGKGEENYVKQIINLAKKLSIKNISFFGFVDQRKKFELLARAHILINPSAREGWGLVNIEANSVGTPVVGYNVPGTKDSVGEGVSGSLVKKGDWKIMAEKILTLLGDKDKYKSYQSSSVEWSKQFNWSKSKKQSLELIEKLTS